jgi:hypothetical protein
MGTVATPWSDLPLTRSRSDPGPRNLLATQIPDLNPPPKRATLCTRCFAKEDVVIDGEAWVLAASRP